MASVSSSAFQLPRRCFTLIELLAVIAILSILAGLLLPALSSARQNAQSVNCLGNMKQVSAVFLLYANDYDGYLPCRDNIGPGINGYGETISAKNWLDDQMRIYIGKNQVSVAPAKVLFCPEEKGKEDMTTNYGLNYLIATENGRGIKTTRFPDSAQTAMLVENYGHLCYYCYALNQTGSHSFGSAYGNNRAAFFRHKGRVSTAFLDGHAALLEKGRVPCRESFPEESEENLKNTLFNSGKRENSAL